MCIGCRDLFEYSPNQVFDDTTPVALNEQNIALLSQTTADDTVTIAFIGDSQRFYDELEDFVEKVNSIPEIDFVILAGDISDFGLLEEFELVTDRLSDLRKPYIGVVGNHDLVARGEETYLRVFGPLDFSFVYGRIQFIAHNTNAWETEGDAPDIDWIERQLRQRSGIDYRIPISHIPPFGAEFDSTKVGRYTSLWQETPGLLVSLHGHVHQHNDSIFYNDGVRYITSHSFDQTSFITLTIINGKMEKQIIDY